MVNPAWFFSTISQATAASVGFVIAFSASLYSVRASRTETKLSSLREESRQLHRHYAGYIKWARSQLAEQGDFDTEGAVMLVVVPSDLREWLSHQNTPTAAHLWLRYGYLEQALESLCTVSEPWQLPAGPNDLQSEIRIIQNIISNEGPLEVLEEELEIENPSYAFRGDFDRFAGQESEFLHEFLGSLNGWNIVLTQLLGEIERMSERYDIDRETDEVKGILKYSLYLLCGGVLLPQAFLLSFDSIRELPKIPGTWLLFIEISILVFVSVYSLKLYQELADFLMGKGISSLRKLAEVIRG